MEQYLNNIVAGLQTNISDEYVTYLNELVANKQWRDLVGILSLIPLNVLQAYDVTTSLLDDVCKEYIQVIQQGSDMPLPTADEIKTDQSSIFIYAYLRITTLDFLCEHLKSVDRFDPYTVIPLLPTACYLLNLGHDYITTGPWCDLMIIVGMYEEFADVCRWAKLNQRESDIAQFLHDNQTAASVWLSLQ